MNKELYQSLTDEALRLSEQLDAIKKVLGLVMADKIITQKLPPPTIVEKQRKEKGPVKTKKVKGPKPAKVKRGSSDRTDWNAIFPTIVKFIKGQKDQQASSDDIASFILKDYPHLTVKNIKSNRLYAAAEKGFIKSIGHGVWGIGKKADAPVAYKNRKEETKQPEEKGDFFDPKADRAFND